MKPKLYQLSLNSEIRKVTGLMVRDENTVCRLLRGLR